MRLASSRVSSGSDGLARVGDAGSEQLSVVSEESERATVCCAPAATGIDLDIHCRIVHARGELPLQRQICSPITLDCVSPERLSCLHL